jgi:hypothetical protein
MANQAKRTALLCCCVPPEAQSRTVHWNKPRSVAGNIRHGRRRRRRPTSLVMMIRVIIIMMHHHNSDQ